MKLLVSAMHNGVNHQQSKYTNTGKHLLNFSAWLLPSTTSAMYTTWPWWQCSRTSGTDRVGSNVQGFPLHTFYTHSASAPFSTALLLLASTFSWHIAQRENFWPWLSIIILPPSGISPNLPDTTENQWQNNQRTLPKDQNWPPPNCHWPLWLPPKLLLKLKGASLQTRLKNGNHWLQALIQKLQTHASVANKHCTATPPRYS